MNVLVVDDDGGIRETVEDILKVNKHSVKTASNGRIAIELFSRTSFDLILMDMKMPELSGLETYRIMKRINPNLNVVFMTAYAPDELIEQAKRDSLEILYKPFNVSKLLDKLN